jgi:hypothetical protein
LSENDRAGKESGQETLDESPRLFWGRAACGLGVILAVLGIVAAFFGTGASILPGAVGACLGILGYFLGAGRFGTITIILCTAVLFFGLAASQGLIPGIEGNDRNMPTDAPVAD